MLTGDPCRTKKNVLIRVRSDFNSWVSLLYHLKNLMEEVSHMDQNRNSEKCHRYTSIQNDDLKNDYGMRPIL